MHSIVDFVDVLDVTSIATEPVATFEQRKKKHLQKLLLSAYNKRHLCHTEKLIGRMYTNK